ncbi:hypothetical protein K1X11_013300 [Actomonas aquatica]|uniref:Alpha/beta hydrolase n=1 Tax=Actomonas aquatica TaxID=2866162 RepID=A0ABZ1C271_9BACT|nr:hypothetical protein [Opitutus sp. WL0086]WRQ85782.1 hypothetical protein K1X11_013300 [Opitutus sp. WL0086]
MRNVVLVHGAFVDGSDWRGVHDGLTARSFRVTIVQNPLTSLADDGATLKVYPGGSHALGDTSKDQLNADLLAFARA